jgi:hypothetical protein
MSAPVTLRFHRTLYMHQAVRDAAKVYGEYATLALGADGEYYTVTISDPDPEIDGDLAGELANHALVESFQRRRKRS